MFMFSQTEIFDMCLRKERAAECVMINQRNSESCPHWSCIVDRRKTRWECVSSSVSSINVTNKTVQIHLFTLICLKLFTEQSNLSEFIQLSVTTWKWWQHYIITYWHQTNIRCAGLKGLIHTYFVCPWVWCTVQPAVTAETYNTNERSKYATVKPKQ